MQHFPRRGGFALLTAIVACLVLPTPAGAAGGYLHLREADALARAVQAKSPGHTSLEPCVRVDAHHADCRLVARSASTYCTWTVHVSKFFVGGRYRWRAATTAGDCEYVG